MIKSLRIKWNQFLETAKEQSPREAVLKSVGAYFHLNRVVVPVYNDLSALKQNLPEESSLGFLIVDRSNAESVSGMSKIVSRRLKQICHTQSGFYAYAVATNGEIIGDIWCATPEKVRRTPVHPDLTWLGIECGAKEAYMFDMYVAPKHRGKVVTGFLLGNALEHLRKSGFERVYGFYEQANLPALWVHRLFGYTELPKRKVCRVLLYQKSEPVPVPEPA